MSDIISGRNSVIEALKAERSINRILLAEGIEKGFAAQVVALAKQSGIPYIFTSREQLEKIAGIDNRGIVAEVAAATYAAIDDMLVLAESQNQPPLIVLLDDIEDPHNLGAIIRTALGAGAHGVVIPKRRAAGLNQTVAKVSAGASEYLPVARVANLGNALTELQKAGLWVVAADISGQKFWDIDMSGPLAIVLGSEGKGISPLLKSKCDFVASIPLAGPVNSLNVSAAAAIMLYEAVRQRIKTR
jgi:23S rRNA (guanosine2251-2'-O)-methyltransferase